MSLDALQGLAEAVRTEIGKAVHGQEEAVDMLIVSLFARGHCLLEGPPGTAKTLLAQSLSLALDVNFGRIQFTPDLMPGDVLGANIFDFGANEFRLTKGAVFCDLLLADEINRAPPKTQAALLQVMNERVATIDGLDYDLGDIFTVVATQNPIEQQGTYPLPEAQLDRFLFKINLEFPNEEAEVEILRRHSLQPLDFHARSATVEAVAGAEDIAMGRAVVDNIRLEEDLIRYIVTLVRATREHPDLEHGASTRAADAIAGAARALAALDGRDYAIPDDVQQLFLPALRHRVTLGPAAGIEGRGADEILLAILNQIEAPK